jgi:hypothetical protein
LFVSQTFYEPFNDINVQSRIEATSGGFTLGLSDQVVDVGCWVLTGIQESDLFFGGETFFSWHVVVLFVTPGRAPFFFPQSGRVFLEAPWVFSVSRRNVTTVDIGQTFTLGNTFTTTLFFDEFFW